MKKRVEKLECKTPCKKRVILGLIVIFVFIVIAIFIIPERLKNNSSECNKDEDCVKRQITCCPCSAGGKEICVARDNSSFSNMNEICPPSNEMICPQVYNCEIGSCKCVDGMCQR